MPPVALKPLPFAEGPVLRHMGVFEHIPKDNDRVVKLETARVVTADYRLLQHDFPFLRDENILRAHPRLTGLEAPARREAVHRFIDRWLVANAGFMSAYQVKQSKINTPVTTGKETMRAWRPFNYGRSLVLSLGVSRELPSVVELGFHPADAGGLLDVKGIGLAPSKGYNPSAHANGLLMLGEALRELLYCELITRVLAHAGHIARPVPIYAVLHTGFDAIIQNGNQIPTALLLRRAHLRPIYQWGLKDPGSLTETMEMDIERILRRYGITSTGSDTYVQIRAVDGVVRYYYGEGEMTFSRELQEWILEMTRFNGSNRLFEGVNLQFTEDIKRNPPRPRIVDFGSYWVKEGFHEPLLSLVACRPLRLGRIIWPDDPEFVQPDPQLRVPYEVWGWTEGVWGYGRQGTGIAYPMDNPGLLAHHLAMAFRRGEMTSAEVRAKLDEMIHVAVAGWPEKKPASRSTGTRAL
ncbi:MAG: hypothetical protein QNK37_38915 [Acidobacteriota bacterium]|nr:hypothetical protein [Acidobacteriota bacterium]